MTIGYVFINTAPSKERSVYNELSHVNEITDLHPLAGDYDLIAKVEAADLDSLSHVVIAKIRSIPGVIDTETLLVIKLETDMHK